MPNMLTYLIFLADECEKVLFFFPFTLEDNGEGLPTVCIIRIAQRSLLHTYAMSPVFPSQILAFFPHLVSPLNPPTDRARLSFPPSPCAHFVSGETMPRPCQRRYAFATLRISLQRKLQNNAGLIQVFCNGERRANKYYGKSTKKFLT